MKTAIVENSDLHFEHKQWQNELLFWNDELKSFQNRLNEIVSRWTNKDVLKELDRFQNNFIIHKEKIGEFLEEINLHEHNISEHYKANELVMDRIFYDKHVELRDRIDTQRNIYNELKKNLFTFLTKYM